MRLVKLRKQESGRKGIFSESVLNINAQNFMLSNNLKQSFRHGTLF
ncbi:hypothetical protein QFZ72_001390 [Bacillus sp. V2I10]|nr:hypothetical protein [Bacillus sp. V2I10]